MVKEIERYEERLCTYDVQRRSLLGSYGFYFLLSVVVVNSLLLVPLVDFVVLVVTFSLLGCILLDTVVVLFTSLLTALLQPIAPAKTTSRVTIMIANLPMGRSVLGDACMLI